MTEEQLKQQQAAWENHMRQQIHAQQQAQMQAQQWAREDQMKLHAARAALHESQRMMKASNDLKFVAIVAVDLEGGFSKDGKIPWKYKEDFRWFQGQTEGHICVMGRNTYDDIMRMNGKKATKDVLPKRKTFVVTSRPLEKDNATAIASLNDLSMQLSEEDRKKTIFICGGERIYREAIPLCNELLITVVNKEVGADKFFPTDYASKHFVVTETSKSDTAPDLCFTTWNRKQ